MSWTIKFQSATWTWSDELTAGEVHVATASAISSLFPTFPSVKMGLHLPPVFWTSNARALKAAASDIVPRMSLDWHKRKKTKKTWIDHLVRRKKSPTPPKDMKSVCRQMLHHYGAISCCNMFYYHASRADVLQACERRRRLAYMNGCCNIVHANYISYIRHMHHFAVENTHRLHITIYNHI